MPAAAKTYFKNSKPSWYTAMESEVIIRYQLLVFRSKAHQCRGMVLVPGCLRHHVIFCSPTIFFCMATIFVGGLIFFCLFAYTVRSSFSQDCNTSISMTGKLGQNCYQIFLSPPPLVPNFPDVTEFPFDLLRAVVFRFFSHLSRRTRSLESTSTSTNFFAFGIGSSQWPVMACLAVVLQTKMPGCTYFTQSSNIFYVVGEFLRFWIFTLFGSMPLVTLFFFGSCDSTRWFQFCLGNFYFPWKWTTTDCFWRSEFSTWWFARVLAVAQFDTRWLLFKFIFGFCCFFTFYNFIQGQLNIFRSICNL